MSYPVLFATPGVRDFAEAVDAERQRQIAKWGDMSYYPDGTGRPGDEHLANYFRTVCQANGRAGDNWRDIAAEEVAEAFAETDPDRLETELVQAAAVLQAWFHHLRLRRS